MNEGFNLLENFPINKEFSFFKELEKLGFRKLDDPQKRPKYSIYWNYIRL